MTRVGQIGCAGKRFIAVAFFAAMVAMFACLAAKPLLFIEKPAERADAVVILGGDAGERVFRALEVLKSNRCEVVVISGTNDCYLIRDRMILAGISKDRLFVEGNSKNTKENAEFSIKLLRQHDCKKVIIVTSWYHSRRAMACFKHFSKDIEFASLPAYGVNIKDKPSRGETAFVFHEYIGLLWYAIRYGITPC